MFRNYLTVALRSLLRNRTYSAISMLSLAIGLASSIMILLFLIREQSFDRFNDNADQVVRLYRVEQRPVEENRLSDSLPYALADDLKESVPGVEAIARLRRVGATLQFGTTRLDVAAFLSDANIGSVLTLPVLDASPAPLSQESMRLDRETADLLGVDVGDVVTVGLGSTEMDLTVDAVLSETPGPSSLDIQVLIPMEAAPDRDEMAAEWDWFSVGIFARLQKNVDRDVIAGRIQERVRTRMAGIIDEYIANGWWANDPNAFSVHMQPVTDMHHNPDIRSNWVDSRSPSQGILLSVVGFLVLLLACINFSTLALGRAMTRAQEIGMRKALGAQRMQVIAQFGGEALLTTVGAALFGVLLAESALPVFNSLANQDVDLTMLMNPIGVALIVALVLVATALAGFYPALVLSGYSPVRVMRGDHGGTKGNGFIRSVLVVQFTVTMGLLIGVFFMKAQMDFIDAQPLGFDASRVVVVDLNDSQQKNMDNVDRLRSWAEGRSDVESVSWSNAAFGGSWSRATMASGSSRIIVYTALADADYLQTMGMDLLQGRPFRESDEGGNSILVNEALVRAMGWQDPIGQILPDIGDAEVIGVVKDYRFLSQRQQVPPAILHVNPAYNPVRHALIRVQSADVSGTISALESAWNIMSPDEPLAYEFMDDRMNALYAADRRWNDILRASSLLSVLIALLGIFGVASMNAARRTREIGIRKVLGAGEWGIVSLMLGNMARLLAISAMLAVPLTWVIGNEWLSGFAFRMDLSLWPFLAGTGIAGVVALATAGLKARSAATINPVTALRQ